ncbi:uncharacterized protein si:ch1073-126c3.2 [Pristis pectinata]|uniref:uncharacterized protein si:ch1073-126c3.2 n=1 Tax=Pristis pectinata TaxID=685728 RepID=UPI00223D8499|nr:uncharacterized protein si:ch1073-126c3.2 [Pristis pectinata]
MARTPAVLRLVGFICILTPGAYVMKDAGTCQNAFGLDTYLNFTSGLQSFINCTNQFIKELEPAKRSELYRLLQTAADNLRSIHRKDCQGVIPRNCSSPIVPTGGGLVCLTLNKTRYCKPMCNKGFDFQFLRLSRPYERCGEATEYKWTTQYVGGNQLAVCTEHPTAVSAQPSHYFLEHCRDALYNYSHETDITSTFERELKEKLRGRIKSKNTCLLCGD